MKKKWMSNHDRRSYALSCLIRVMKLTTFFLLITFISVNASVYSQGTRLDLKVQGTSIKDVLNRIEDQSNFFFMYNDRKIDVERKVDLNLKEAKVDVALKTIFEGTNTKFIIKDRQIVLYNESDEDFRGPNSLSGSQQQKPISGKVFDFSGTSLPGVSVIIKGTTTGTITDANGGYSLSSIPANSTLKFSFVGMKTQEIVIGSQTTINVTLVEDAIGIEEVVAIGYGTLKKSDLTGSIVNIDMKEKANNANVNLVQALQGSVPGVNIGVSSAAGGEPNLSIRGKTSLSGSDKPLIVLDGIIFNGSLNDLNINDVETVDVLKDASAAAVYGSRAANGVIIITTKSGELGTPKFTMNVYRGFQDISPTDANKVMNGEQFMTRLVDYSYQSGDLLNWYKTNPTSAEGRPLRPDPTDPIVISNVARSTEEYNNWLAGKEVNWMDEVLRNSASIQNYNLSVSGANDRTSYFISGSYLDQEGIVEGDDYQKATVRINIDNKINDWLRFGIRSSYAFADYSGVSADLSQATYSSPWANMYNPDGTYTIDLAGESVQRNPFSNTVADNEDIRNNFFVTGKIEIDIPWVHGLKYELSYSNSFDSGQDFVYYPSYSLDGSDNYGKAIRKHVFNRNWIVNNIVSYSRTFAKDHRVNATLMGSREKRTFNTSILTGNGFGIENLGYNGIYLASNQFTDSKAEEENNIAYLARLNYTFKDRYLLTGSLRRDGFSGFAPGNKIGVFKSASLGWIMSEENFLNTFNWVDFFKLRLSYG
ncbi:MAG TPA: SusC/RagA family TonB-linked outer membrane protein [Prolixibacteraceae bacterium]|nr:SusC/RagA family TonB-linked outer membrane protein [Prolixibacteraceae bacterium]